MKYIVVKRVVLVFLLAVIAFGFGYLYFGSKLSSMVASPKESGGPGSSGPPAPVMQELKELQDRIAANPKDEEAYAGLANLYFQANKFDQAAGYYEKAAAVNPDDIIAKNNLALCYHLLKQEDKAIATITDAVKRSPGTQHLWLTLGLIDSESGKAADAKKALEQAYRLDPKSDAGVEAKSMLESGKK